MDSLAPLIIVLIILIGIFVLSREFFCWYFKINDRIILMQEQNFLLKKLLFSNSSQVKSIDTTVTKTPEQSENERIDSEKEKKSSERKKLIIALIIIGVGVMALLLRYLT